MNLAIIGWLDKDRAGGVSAGCGMRQMLFGNINSKKENIYIVKQKPPSASTLHRQVVQSVRPQHPF